MTQPLRASQTRHKNCLTENESVVLVSQIWLIRDLPPPLPAAYFLINFQLPRKLVTFPNNLSVIFQNSNCFLQCEHLFTTRCYFLCMSCVGILNTSLTIFVVFLSSEGLVKAYNHLSNNAFHIDTFVISLSSYIWENTELLWPPWNTPFKIRLGNRQLPREICISSNVLRQIIAEAKLS